MINRASLSLMIDPGATSSCLLHLIVDIEDKETNCWLGWIELRSGGMPFKDPFQLRIQDFTEVAPTQWGANLLFSKIFAENERNWTERIRVSLSPLKSSTAFTSTRFIVDTVHSNQYGNHIDAGPIQWWWYSLLCIMFKNKLVIVAVADDPYERTFTHLLSPLFPHYLDSGGSRISREVRTPEVGAITKLFCKIFAENCMKKERIWTEKGVRFSSAPFGSANNRPKFSGCHAMRRSLCRNLPTGNHGSTPACPTCTPVIRPLHSVPLSRASININKHSKTTGNSSWTSRTWPITEVFCGN